MEEELGLALVEAVAQADDARREEKVTSTAN